MKKTMNIINTIKNKFARNKGMIFFIFIFCSILLYLAYTFSFETIITTFKDNEHLDYLVKNGSNWAMVIVTICTVWYLKLTFDQQRNETRENDFKNNFHYLLDSYKRSKENLKLYRVSNPQSSTTLVHYDKLVCSGEEVFKLAKNDIVKGINLTDTCYEGYISGIHSYINSLNALIHYYEQHNIANEFLKKDLLLTIQNSITSEESLYLMSVTKHSQAFTELRENLQKFHVFSLNKISIENISIMTNTLLNPPTPEQREQLMMIFHLFPKAEIQTNFKELLTGNMISKEQYSHLLPLLMD